MIRHGLTTSESMEESTNGRQFQKNLFRLQKTRVQSSSGWRQAESAVFTEADFKISSS